MDDCINREAAWNGIYDCPTKTDADGYIWVRTRDVAHMIDELPAADVKPVVHANWERTETDLGTCCICTNCGSCPSMEYKFCPYCGADMREVENAEIHQS